MTTKQVCYDNIILYQSNELSREEAFAFGIVEHVVGSCLYYAVETDNFTPKLLEIARDEDFLISESLFTRVVDAGLVRKSPVFTRDYLHKTINNAKKHCAEEWEILDRAQAS